ncbi:hypothetical protein HCN44_005382 [Aphidius gifuensis]|uniref:Chitin-binding type-2 domain-containing protein n=1 Tax=Aphidius gifuensis TaxID=684658 RepID=A0A834Y303_APHGI|nr:peritrophin-1-like [Aphidius gifuensis]KAF7997105.1 hypothetical protein HCN44_005382 [Aphidius gifuensis]
MKNHFVVFCIVALCYFTIVLSNDDKKQICIGKCPPSNPSNDVYFLPHMNCSKFCSCNFGNAIELDCPAGLQYYPQLRVCTYPYEAKCNDSFVQPGTTPRPKPVPTKPTPTPTPTTLDPDEFKKIVKKPQTYFKLI